LANERTHLATVRTALAFVSFGVTLNRFSIYLLAQDQTEPSRGSLALEHSKFAGLGMVFLGLFLLIWSVSQYRRILRAIAERKFIPPRLSLTVVTTFFIALAFIGAVWMILD
jgi:putative membrane protein